MVKRGFKGGVSTLHSGRRLVVQQTLVFSMFMFRNNTGVFPFLYSDVGSNYTPFFILWLLTALIINAVDLLMALNFRQIALKFPPTIHSIL